MNGSTPAIVLGGTGYVAGELLRLIAGHPQLYVAAILSDSQPGAPVAGAFALTFHTAGVLGKLLAESFDVADRQPAEALHPRHAASV